MDMWVASISDELGYTTVKVASLSKPVFDFSDAKGRRSRSVSVSEQRRALLLPQEVKELGTEEALIFFEGLRPIRCRKVRYFEDGRFRARLLPPPRMAGIAPIPSETPPAKPARPDVKMAPSPGGDAKGVTRVATVEDLERIESLTLEDFEADLSKVEVPETQPGERLSEPQMEAVVESLLATLKEGGRAR
jgi:type IV secretion system protein VirD4